MAKQEVENGRLIRRKKPAFAGDKHPQVGVFGDMIRTGDEAVMVGDDHTPGDHGLLEVGGGDLLNTGEVLMRDNRGVNQDLQELKDKYERLIEALRAHGIRISDDGDLTGEQELQLAFARQARQAQQRLPAAMDADPTDEMLAQLQKQVEEIQHRRPTFD